MNITGNTVLITGGTSGIGLGLALRLREAGNAVIIAGRRKELLDAITAEHPDIAAVELDVTDPDSIDRARASLVMTHPDLNILVNNAGIQLRENPLEPLDLQVAEQQITTNLLGPIRMAYAFTPLLAGQTGAAIVNVTSALAFVPFPATPTYSATKAALHSFTESQRIRLAGTGIQVVEIVPAGVRTDLLDQKDNPDAMPLDEFLDQIMTQWRENPGAPELVAEPARGIRGATADGSYDDLLALFSTL
ncbi:SDR family NAD(P)-dependent oxidoreductase [Herbiconiux sp.]|uniref:SDR family oxidoreductase n=1 Tax=Herbiconiux sp. TaxID=1871186 RepID=UPI0025C345A7|nr:SDR family NAD(P)-dependent oxidoreductase [Herbiconiux sp.]